MSLRSVGVGRSMRGREEETFQFRFEVRSLEVEKRIGEREIVVGLQGTRREEQSQKAALDRIAQTVKDFAASFLSAQRIPSSGGSIEKLQAGDSRQGDFAAPYAIYGDQFLESAAEPLFPQGLPIKPV